MIDTNSLIIRPMEMEDVRIKVKWVNDEKFRSTLGFEDFPVSIISTEEWLKKSSLNYSRKDFFVCLKETGQPIGFGGLKNVDLINLKAESYLGIGDVNSWGKGFGYEIKKALVEYGFNQFNLNKIYSYHQATNTAAIKINIKLGGKQEGLLREDIRENGIMKDMVIMSILRKEYFEL